MKPKPIQITTADHQKLAQLIDDLSPDHHPLPAHLQGLRGELDRAELKDYSEIPDDLVTLNSKVRLIEEGSNDTMEFTLVPPDAANVDEGKISVLSPLGTAMLGYRVGNSFEWATPTGAKCRARVDQILFQPEQVTRSQNET